MVAEGAPFSVMCIVSRVRDAGTELCVDSSRGATALLGHTATACFLTVRAEFSFISVRCPALLDSVWPSSHPMFCSPAFPPIQETGVCLWHF